MGVDPKASAAGFFPYRRRSDRTTNCNGDIEGFALEPVAIDRAKKSNARPVVARLDIEVVLDAPASMRSGGDANAKIERRGSEVAIEERLRKIAPYRKAGPCSDLGRGNAEELRRRKEIDDEPKSYREHQQGKQKTQVLGAKILAGRRPSLRADNATGHQEKSERNVDRLVGRRLQNRGDRADENDLKQRGADRDIRWDAEKINQDRDHDKTAAHAHDTGHETDKRPKRYGGKRADIELRRLEACLERQPVNPVVLSGRRAGKGWPLRTLLSARRLSTSIILPTALMKMT